jgi:hypothetical protein
LRQKVFQVRIEGNDFQVLHRAVDQVDNGRRQRHAHFTGQIARILSTPRMLGQAFHDLLLSAHGREAIVDAGFSPVD